MIRRRGWLWLLWSGALVLNTVVLLSLRGALDKAHFALAYLLVVLGASASGGRRMGLVIAVVAFFCFNFFLLPPYHTLVVADRRDWLVLFVFLVTGAVAAYLLERARTEADRVGALREADHFKDSLLASVSHDLRTPLTTIKAMAHAIAQEGEVRAAVIEAETDRLNAFVGDLLDLSRIQGGVLPVQTELIAAEDLLGVAIQRVSPSFKGRELRTELHGDASLLVGHFDFQHALRVVANLLENANKYSPPEEPIEIRVDRTSEQLRFRVEDRGPGIPSGESERIWEPFYRPADASHKADGTGLGLAIARRLAEAQNGTLEYHPRTGGGSVFVLSVPAASTAELDAMSL
jgi:two-component system sensor histidine kinase KdpD